MDNVKQEKHPEKVYLQKNIQKEMLILINYKAKISKYVYIYSWSYNTD